MKSTVSVQVDADVMLRLISHLKVRGGAQDVCEAVSGAVGLWLREQSQLPFDCDPATGRPHHGPLAGRTASTTAIRSAAGTFRAARAVRATGAATPLTPGEGWNLPERRKFRFRLEDVAFD